MSKLTTTRTLALLAVLCASGALRAQGNVFPQQQQGLSLGNSFGGENDFAATVLAGDEEAQAAEAARSAEAERNFDAIVIPQNNIDAVGNAGLGMNTSPGRMARWQAIAASEDRPAIPASPVAAMLPSVELSLEEYASLRAELNRVREEAARRQGPAVVLGASRYSGKAIQGALSLRLELQVTLGRRGSWKTVPIVGDDVVLVRAQVDGKDLPVSRMRGYHVWVTQATGEVSIDAEILVPSRGPRGSIEYDFLVARTPVTSFQCQFPVPGLEPRMNAAVQSKSSPAEGGTQFTATLRPTTHIHMLGFKDMGDDSEQKAKTYAESLHLLSVEEGALELFSVVRYTILYSGAKEFLLQLPPGMKVVSAEGMGAFRWEIQSAGAGQRVLRGETAFPIRNKFEISLRLRRELPKDSDGQFDAPLPRCLGVERESGWLGLEVPGKLQLETGAPRAADAIDVRQLPAEMIRSAVSPILRAYRFHEPEPKIGLKVNHLPEIEPASDSVDRVRAFSKITAEGNLLTDMRISLRNRLLQNLKMRLPAGAQIKSALLDGQPFNPSRDSEGLILLPLKRSSGRDRLRPFTLSVVIEQKIPAMGLFGWPQLELPRLDLPVSSLAWTVYVPGRNLYSALEGDLENQRYVGRASWHTPGYSPAPAAIQGPTGGLRAVSMEDASASADAGAMPVRFKVPKEGKRLEHHRYWIAAQTPVSVSFSYARSWLRIPAWLAMSLLLGLGLWLISLRFRPLPAQFCPWLGGALVAGAGWMGHDMGGKGALVLGAVLGLTFIGFHRAWLRRLAESGSTWITGVKSRFQQRQRNPDAWRTGRVAANILLSIGLCFFGILFLDVFFEMLWLLLHPLGG